MNLELWKKIKKEKKLTNKKIAEITKIPIRTIEDIFRGATLTPRIDTVEAIEKALGIENNSDWTAEDYENGVTDKKRVWITADEETWLNYRKELNKLSAQDYNTVCLLIETLTKNKK